MNFDFSKIIILTLVILYSAIYSGCAEETSQLEDELQSEQNILEKQRISIEELKSQIKIQEQQINFTLPSTAGTNLNEIANLSDYIERLKDAQSLTRETSTELSEDQREQARLTKEQLLPAYETLRQNIPHTEAQITSLTSLTLRNKEQDLLLENLRIRTLAERQQMAYLQDQMVEIDSNLLRNLSQISYNTQLQKREIASAVNEAQEEIVNRREFRNNLESNNFLIRTSLIQLNQKLRDAENTYAIQLKKIQSLQTQINKTKRL